MHVAYLPRNRAQQKVSPHTGTLSSCSNFNRSTPSCNKFAFLFTGSFAFPSILAIKFLEGLLTSVHSPGYEAKFLKRCLLLAFWLYSKSWYQITVFLSSSEPLAPALFDDSSSRQCHLVIDPLWTPGTLGFADSWFLLLFHLHAHCVIVYVYSHCDVFVKPTGHS